MPAHDILVLAFIVAQFVSFGVVLAVVSWYCRGSTMVRRADTAGRRSNYPTAGRLITDDD